jgi:L-threonylcarbamoyladenylate synthase
MILYPTETLYALGVNALDEKELQKLYALKERDATKAASWLVRDIEDIKKYAEVGEKAEKIIREFLPGKLTIVLQAKKSVPKGVIAHDGTIAFRISNDSLAQKTVTEFMEKYDAPLTCTSANVSGLATLSTPGEILQQFGPKGKGIDTVVDDGPRKGLASTIVRVVGERVTVLREGDITEVQIVQVAV